MISLILGLALVGFLVSDVFPTSALADVEQRSSIHLENLDHFLDADALYGDEEVA